MTTERKTYSEFTTIAIIGAGTIGLSFASLHFSASCKPLARVVIYDTRSHLREYIEAKLPGSSH